MLPPKEGSPSLWEWKVAILELAGKGLYEPKSTWKAVARGSFQGDHLMHVAQVSSGHPSEKLHAFSALDELPASVRAGPRLHG